MLCVCQNSDRSGQTFAGYLNSFNVRVVGFETVNMLCSKGSTPATD
jgi:hypothetical protein